MSSRNGSAAWCCGWDACCRTPRPAGLRLVFWPIETLYRISLRIETLDVPSQDIITRDNVSVKVNAVCYFRVVDANLAVSQVQNYLYATSQKAQTTLRSIVGQFELDEILAEREKVNSKLQVILDQDTEPWGIKVTKVEVKQVDIPEQMQRAIARQAEAERERRAKVIHAEGEAQASAKLAEAAQVLETQPAAIQLRYLQTLTEIGGGEKHDHRVSAADRHHQCVGEEVARAGALMAAGKGKGAAAIWCWRAAPRRGIHFARGDFWRGFYAGISAGTQPVRIAACRRQQLAVEAGGRRQQTREAWPRIGEKTTSTTPSSPVSDWDFFRPAEPANPAESGPEVPKSPKSLVPSRTNVPAPVNASPSPSVDTMRSNLKSVSPPPIPQGSTVLQIAAMARPSDAVALAQALQQKRFPAFVLPPGSDHYYRVQVGPYQTQNPPISPGRSLKTKASKPSPAVKARRAAGVAEFRGYLPEDRLAGEIMSRRWRILLSDSRACCSLLPFPISICRF